MYQKTILLPAVLFLSIFLSFQTSFSQEIPVSQIKKQIENYKKDPKGPYYRIKWFCEDGSIRDPKDPCPESIGGGIQHASYKPEVEKLAKNNQIYFGNILSYNSFDEFWDATENHSKVKQYQLVKYLSSIDDGWIYRKGKYYRGAMQSEDEEAWGKDFYLTLLKKGDVIHSNYYLIKQSLKDVPHAGDSNMAQLMRSQSKVLAEEIPSFMDVRIKIHGNPDKSDIETVKKYKDSNKNKLSPEQIKKTDDLIQTLETYYTPVNTETLIGQLNNIKTNDESKQLLIGQVENYSQQTSVDEKVQLLSNLICNIRYDLENIKKEDDRLLLLDLSNTLENSLFIQTLEWQPQTLDDLILKIKTLSYAALGSGLIEFWEWESIKDQIEIDNTSNAISLKELQNFLIASRSIVEWSTAMVKAVYGEEVGLYTEFEPKAYQFIDDRIRSSIVLDLGKSVSELGNFIAKESSIENNVLDIQGQASIRGLNPGYAYGELVVVQGNVENTNFDKDKIYVFEYPPSSLKPVAGIMTVSEGNLVSHVQLLARNLGIPNAAVSDKNLKSLSKFNGKKVFYAVTEKGNAILKLEKDMSSAEKNLFSEAQKNTNKIKVPVDRIELDQTNIMNMKDINADDSGRICGPKAANLGQLKSIFPKHVVEGFVFPFGIFRKHLENTMPGQNVSYWTYLNDTYAKADAMKKSGKSEKDIEAYQLERFNNLRKAIENMQLNEDFLTQLNSQFKSVFGTSIGSLPVFLRSDTNMEDLEEFTGAGLNLTMFNILSKKEIIDGIKKVWASPYTDRSLKWRQKYLLNPEYVFPSILVIPGVNVDYSGVVITKGINAGGEKDLTIAFSKGAGGAVDGQSAETRVVFNNGNQLLYPARESHYLTLPKSGGTKIAYTGFEKPILNEGNIQAIKDIVKEVRVTMPKRTDPNYKGAYDLEMGFENNKLWLFQIRPFVENKKAKSSDYLKSITPKIDYKKEISLSEKI